MSSTMQNRAAWLMEPKAHPFVIKEAPMPTPGPGEVVIRVRAVGINIADYGIQALGMLLQESNYPSIIGVDVAGEVVDVGADGKKEARSFVKGDRVLALVSAMTFKDARYGAFQLYTVAVGSFVAKIPDRVPFREAAVLPLPLCTAAYSLFMKEALALELPQQEQKSTSRGETLVVWGGSSAVGMCAIQMARAAGYTVAATASPRNFEALRGLGAEYTFDYHDEEGAVDEIVAALEARGEESSVGVFAAMIGSLTDMADKARTLSRLAALADRLGGARRLGTVLPRAMLNALAVDLPEGVVMSQNYATDIRGEACGQALWEEGWLSGALEDGSMRCKPDAEVVGRGLESLQEAVDLVAKGVSAKKLVVELP